MYRVIRLGAPRNGLGMGQQVFEEPIQFCDRLLALAFEDIGRINIPEQEALQLEARFARIPG